jgi:4-hydroxy-3-methylbut-2-enyl diphosphate reductase
VSVLVQRASELDWAKFEGISRLGITAGASAPEVIVEEIMDAFATHYKLHVETVSAAEEDEFFPLPRPLRNEVAAVTEKAAG